VTQEDSVPAPLRREVRLLSTLLGRVLREAAGPEVLNDVETLRIATIGLRRDPGEGRRRQVLAIVDSFDHERAHAVARAFTCYFQLVNLAEEHQRVRMLRERPARSDSIVEGVRLVRERERDRRLGAHVERLEITPVLTAHPTEARRRAVVETLWRIADELERLDEPHVDTGDVERRLLEEITALWHTDQLRRHRPEPLDEVRAVLALFDQTIFRALPAICRELDEAVAPGTGSRPPAFAGAPIRWGTWVGGDRDGNPSVTAEVTRAAARIASEHALLGLEAATRRLARAISVSDGDAPPSSELLEALASDERRFPDVARELGRKLPDAPHRRKLVVAADRLAATRAGAANRYRSADEYASDLRGVQDSLARAGAGRLAFGELQHLRWQAEAFGFHLAELEIRQHSSVHARAVEELRRDPRSVGESTSEVLETFRAIDDIQHDLGPASCRRYVVSFTHGARDVLDVLALARAAVPGGLTELDVVPLFETREDLRNAARILDELLADRDFVARVERVGRRMEVMLGYSDSAKEVGMLAANLQLHRAQLDLARWARRNDVALTIFHGRGGALGRGGGPTNRAILGQAPGSVSDRFKVTEQGEIAFARYGNDHIARRHLEQLVNAVLVASTREHERTLRTNWGRFRRDAERMGVASERAWHALLRRPGFSESFLLATPMDEIESLQLASRPARRTGSRDVESLRAISWVFAWSQSRVNLPGWYGLGAGLASIADEPGGLERLRDMHAEWPFFTSLLENAELSLAKTDMTVADLYLDLASDPGLTKEIRTEFERSLELTLAVTGHEAPLAGKPVLRRAVDLRNPYVDALSFLQLRFLRELRETGDEDARRLVHLTINGVAAGLQNTG
jgi:phosphoenolpyruvate carboxylase